MKKYPPGPQSRQTMGNLYVVYFPSRLFLLRLPRLLNNFKVNITKRAQRVFTHENLPTIVNSRKP